MITSMWWVANGALLGLGIVLAVAGFIGTTTPQRPWPWQGERGTVARQFAAQRRLLLGLGGAALVGVWLVTGMVMAGLIAGAVIVGGPWLLSGTALTRTQIARRDALGDWAQRLSEMVRLGNALEKALIASRKHAPAALAGEVGELADKVQAQWPTHEALADFARGFDDVTGDKVCSALILAARDPGPGLAQAMQDLAASVREEVTMRQRIEADRQKTRTTVRTLTVITLGIVGLGFTVPQYTGVYATVTGQLVLALLTAGFVATLVWVRRYATRGHSARVLVPDPRSPVRTPPPADETLPAPRAEL
ncbi:type II secretion system F family protein [Streptomyces longispororuber]|uniref:type II secretion system F family protein n=1 Tax=Streptomyces longispororuber TaxID=68230 RepID=UPI00210994AB|nr:type II secretion system F family protein [Streptomyces longispororuber]MCQ4214256.1 type II secretion system F family protein [Streptomyces longispororuber]